MGKKKRLLKQQLVKAEETQTLIQRLQTQGRVDQAVELKQRTKWKSAFDKSEGRKVRDDVSLIRASLKQESKAKSKSRKEWKARLEAIDVKKEKQQMKRVKNLQHRRRQKQEKKMAIARKKGRLF